MEFPRDLSEYEWIKFAQKSGNGHINAYQLAVGDAFDESSYEILNNTETNIHKIEGEKVTEVASGSSTSMPWISSSHGSAFGIGGTSSAPASGFGDSPDRKSVV